MPRSGALSLRRDQRRAGGPSTRSLLRGRSRVARRAGSRSRSASTRRSVKGSTPRCSPRSTRRASRSRARSSRSPSPALGDARSVAVALATNGSDEVVACLLSSVRSNAARCEGSRQRGRGPRRRSSCGDRKGDEARPVARGEAKGELLRWLLGSRRWSGHQGSKELSNDLAPMSELDEARARIFELEIQVHKTRLSAELAEATVRMAEAEARSEKLSQRVADLESALSRRTVRTYSALRGLRRFADLGARDG